MNLAFKKFILIGIILVYLLSACTSTVVQETATMPPPTGLPTLPPTPTQVPTATLPSPTPTSGPQCTVLQDLNFRIGPGTAYNPPISVLQKDVRVVPQGFNPQGVPGGPWVQVLDPASNQVGWVSAGAQVVSCNIDLANLPQVAVAPPPPPPPPRVSDVPPQGTFPDEWESQVVFFEEGFVQMRVRVRAVGPNDGDGIDTVNFQVLDPDGRLVYERTERQAHYCIFGGGEPTCNPWTVEDFTYKWTPGGEPVREGPHTLLIVVNSKPDQFGDSTRGNWNIALDLTIP